MVDFIESNYWFVNKAWEVEAPRLTTRLHPSLTRVDASYFKSPHVFLFSSEYYYKFEIDPYFDLVLMPDFPKPIAHGYPGLPKGSFDEVIRHDTLLWFFQGNNVTVYTPEKFPPVNAEDGRLRLSNINGMPEKVTAAFVDESNRHASFVFHNGLAFKLTSFEPTLRARARNFPRTFAEWMHCSTSKFWP